MDYFAIGEDKSLKNLNDIESWEKLWENPNPTSNFEAQTIQLSDLLYVNDEIAIEYEILGKTSSYHVSYFIMHDGYKNNVHLNWSQVTNLELQVATRLCEIIISTGKINVLDSILCSVKPSGTKIETQYKPYCAPLAIYRRTTKQFN